MRLTCLKCGHQIELESSPAEITVDCPCGQQHVFPSVHNTGILPNYRAAERSRLRAFRAAGLVKNIGGIALTMSLIAIPFYPLGLIGALLGLYVLIRLRGPVARYSGRTAAIIAIILGIAVFIVGLTFTERYFETKKYQRANAMQQSIIKDLHDLLRSQRLFRVSSDTFGTFKEFRFTPIYGHYTIYLGPDDFISALREGETIIDPLPEDSMPAVTEDSFTAVAVGNIDSDPQLDVWELYDNGEIIHCVNDLDAKP
ncbi:MAG: hypothetical protein JW841_00680 [Deltaproteobacteria bacterium]|nr:hypothetical protein [Deltaproteobacteria bacterium]